MVMRTASEVTRHGMWLRSCGAGNVLVRIRLDKFRLKLLYIAPQTCGLRAGVSGQDGGGAWRRTGLGQEALGEEQLGIEEGLEVADGREEVLAKECAAA